MRYWLSAIVICIGLCGIVFPRLSFAEVTPAIECGAMATPIEHLICSDGKLADLHKRIGYWLRTLQSTKDANARQILGVQQEWDASVAKICAAPEAWPMPDVAREPVINCLMWNYRLRADALEGASFSFGPPQCMDACGPLPPRQRDRMFCESGNKRSAAACEAFLSHGNVRPIGRPEGGATFAVGIPAGFREIIWAPLLKYDSPQVGNFGGWSIELSEGRANFAQGGNQAIFHLTYGEIFTRSGAGKFYHEEGTRYFLSFPGRSGDVRETLVHMLRSILSTQPYLVAPGFNAVENANTVNTLTTTTRIVTDGEHTYALPMNSSVVTFIELLPDGSAHSLGTYQSVGFRWVWSVTRISRGHPCPAKGGDDVTIESQLPIVWVGLTPGSNHPPETKATFAGASTKSQYVFAENEITEPNGVWPVKFHKVRTEDLRDYISSGKKISQLHFSDEIHAITNNSDLNQDIINTRSGTYLRTYEDHGHEWMDSVFTWIGRDFLDSDVSWESRPVVCRLSVAYEPPESPLR